MTQQQANSSNNNEHEHNKNDQRQSVKLHTDSVMEQLEKILEESSKRTSEDFIDFTAVHDGYVCFHFAASVPVPLGVFDHLIQ